MYQFMEKLGDNPIEHTLAKLDDALVLAPEEDPDSTWKWDKENDVIRAWHTAVSNQASFIGMGLDFDKRVIIALALGNKTLLIYDQQYVLA